MKKILWLDDLRNPFIDLEGTTPKKEGIIEWVLNYEQFVQWIEKFGLPSVISFDHDLADIDGDSANHSEKTGFDCAKWLSEYCQDNGKILPTFYVHSANPVGAENIINFLNNHKKHIES
ncbi:MAG: cyclic-phosphate processing receiver domain-containing protein [Flavobacteriales bacterium]